jgi:hypothetical protein
VVAGSIVIKSASSAYDSNLPGTSKVSGTSYWRNVRRVLVHEMGHVYLYSLTRTSRTYADYWFIECNARFVQLGNDPVSKIELLDELKGKIL